MASLWLIGASVLEFRWLMQNHGQWERFFVTALAIYLPFAYLLQVLFVLGRDESGPQLFSVNAAAIAAAAAAAAAALGVLARIDLPSHRRAVVRHKAVTQS
jgi:hypothetical protein